MNKGVSLALVGASGVVGTKIIQLLEKRAFPLDKFIPLGNSTVGSSIQFNNQKYQIESLQNFSPFIDPVARKNRNKIFDILCSRFKACNTNVMNHKKSLSFS